MRFCSGFRDGTLVLAEGGRGGASHHHEDRKKKIRIKKKIERQRRNRARTFVALMHNGDVTQVDASDALG